MNYTSIKQSKKLLELGLNPESADMWYNIDIVDKFGIDSYNDKPSFENYQFGDIPCWTTDALISMMPPYFFEWERGIDLIMYPSLDKKKGWNLAYMPNNINDMQKDKFRQITHGDTPLKAAYTMMIWLLENNYIKKK